MLCSAWGEQADCGWFAFDGGRRGPDRGLVGI